MKKIIIGGAFLATTLLFAEAPASYGPCMVCHGKNGEKSAPPKSLIIKDMKKEDFIAALNGYKNGTYGGPTKALMTPTASKLSDADIKEIANYIIK